MFELGDKEWATRLYKKAEGKDYYVEFITSSDFSGLANSIHENLGDKEWAKNMYEKALEVAEYNDDSEYEIETIKEKLEELG